MNNKPTQDLKSYLRKEICQHQWAARIKNIVVQLLYLSVIVFYAITALKGYFQLTAEQSVAAAAMPGIILLLVNTFRYEEKAKWNKLKQRKLDALYRKLIYEEASEKEISAEMTTALENLDQLRVALNKPDAPKK